MPEADVPPSSGEMFARIISRTIGAFDGRNDLSIFIGEERRIGRPQH
jgi:hypothetical protein